MPINNTVNTLNLTVTYQPISMFKWQMYSAQDMRNRFNIMASLMSDDNDHEDDDQDSIKEAFLETNLYLLIITFIISIVHSVFEFLAFKNGKIRYILSSMINNRCVRTSYLFIAKCMPQIY